MPEFKPVNSIKARCEADELHHGQLVWAVLIDSKTDKLDIVPCRVMQRHDNREIKGTWHIMYDLRYPVIKGLCVEWYILWTETDILFQDKESALIAAEAWIREKLKENADFMEKIAADDKSWDYDSNTGAYNGN